MSIQDSNPRPLEHESSPITTRPGLPPNIQPYLLTVTKRRSSLIYVVLQQTSFEDASNRQDRGARSAFFFRSPPRFRELGGSADAATRATLEMG